MSESNKTTLNCVMLCHLGGLALYIGIPLGNILAPLVIWLLKKNSDPAVDTAGREALNFNISFTVYAVIAGLMCYILVGFVVLPVVLITHIVLVIKAALKANKGESVKYPFSLRFIN